MIEESLGEDAVCHNFEMFMTSRVLEDVNKNLSIFALLGLGHISIIESTRLLS